MSEKGKCVNCGRELIIYYNQMCQVCYRRKLRERKNMKYKSTYQGNSDKIKKILNLYIQKKFTIKEISQIVDYEYSNTQKVISKYIVKVGVDSE